tara:strand:- start:21 stop:716 length:696 start_codon:yes stop_codon:yes gene_type:complete
MRKIIFLIKNKTSFLVIFYFIIQKFKNLIIKQKIKKFKRNHQFFLKEKKISTDFFSMNAFNFYNYLKNLRNDFEYLEIGSFEGNSAMFIAENFKDCKIYCVDTWIGHEQYFKDKNFNEIEKNFNLNTKNYSNIIKIKNKSDAFFKENKDLKFDVIYVDGDHYSDQVSLDCLNAWALLKKNGILICDDYIWSYFDDIKKNPCYAINMFLKKIKNKYKILQVSKSQIFLRKLD